MATSPPFAGSPPGSNSTPISRKRPSLSTSLTGSKRRKPSIAGPSHLRQTSFPPEEGFRGTRSPSIDSSALAGTPSILSGSGAGRKGKPNKSGSGSVIAGGSRVNGAGRGAVGSAVDGEAGEEDAEEDEDDAQENLQGEESNEAEKQQEARALEVLLETFDSEQTRLYNQYMGVGRNIGPKIRKLANHTLSQSVPASVVITIASYTKVFMGEVIEMARQVQLEWLAAEPTFVNGEKVPAEATVKDKIKQEWRGPLTPDHLREALRRMKKNKVGGAAGFQGVSLHGKLASAPKMGGKKLFR